MLAVRTPGAPQVTRSVARPAILPSPLGDRVGYSDHVRFRGYSPVHFIPAYNLPVYASRWPLPDTTQDSVHGCSLGFTAAAISGDGDQRTCKAQLPHHQAYGSVPWRFESLANTHLIAMLRRASGGALLATAHRAWRNRRRTQEEARPRRALGQGRGPRPHLPHRLLRGGHHETPQNTSAAPKTVN
jgi:hypothetical protein